ncbi:MAG: oligopeptidase B, partial [Bacteroidota bacterium]
MSTKKIIRAPRATKIPKELSTHGDTRIDNYYWLNDRENPKVIDYLNKENSFREDKMAHTKEFQEKLFEEIVGRIKQTDMSVPFKKDGYYYYTRYEEGKEYPIHARKKETLEADEEIMLNVNELAKEYDYYAVGSRSVSTNNKILAFGEDTVSRRIYTLRFKNLETGEYLPDRIENTTGS